MELCRIKLKDGPFKFHPIAECGLPISSKLNNGWVKSTKNAIKNLIGKIFAS
jgi:hypothetical protein